MNRKTKIIISITGIILILLILIGFTYGYYMVNIHGNSSNKSVEVSIGESKLEFTDLTTSNVDEIIEPGYENIKLFTVKNIGTITGKYSIYLTDVYNGFSRKEDITYTLYRKSGNNTIDTSDLSDCEVLVENAIYPSSKALVKANEKIDELVAKGAKQTAVLVVHSDLIYTNDYEGYYNVDSVKKLTRNR